MFMYNSNADYNIMTVQNLRQNVKIKSENTTQIEGNLFLALQKKCNLH